MKLKEEINRLCGELKKARQRIVQLEVSKESENLFDALAFGHSGPISMAFKTFEDLSRPFGPRPFSTRYSPRCFQAAARRGVVVVLLLCIISQ